MTSTNKAFLLLAVGAIAAASYFIFTDAERGAVACTQEARLCPDGTYVGRSGPTCEFAVCPTVEHRPDWTASSTAELSFEFPHTVATDEYVHATDWPPTVSLSQGAFSCEATTAPGTTRVLRTIGATPYCIDIQEDAAAGSRYTTYRYSFGRDAGIVSISMTIRRVQCMNYDAERQTACLAAQAAFDPDALAASIAGTIRFLAQPPVVPAI